MANRDGQDLRETMWGVLMERRAFMIGLLAVPAAASATLSRDAIDKVGGADELGAKTPAQQLREMMDREELRELIGRYAHRVAQGVSVADMLTDDGAFIVRYPDRPPVENRGRKALDAVYGATARATQTPLPMIHNILLEIDGDKAWGVCSNELRMVEDGKSMIGSGYYRDEYRRVNGRWKFVVRDMTFIHWVPIQQGWESQTRPD